MLAHIKILYVNFGIFVFLANFCGDSLVTGGEY